MNKKFLVFINRDFEPVIALGVVSYHKFIEFPKEYGKCACRCGGGWWEITEDGTLRLYDDSADFGKYDAQYAQEAFDNGNVSFEDYSFEELNIKKLVMQ